MSHSKQLPSVMTSTPSKRIFFLTADNQVPSGGRAFIYHLVDILNDDGFEAYVLHQKKNFRCSWFDNSTPVRWTRQIKPPHVRTTRRKVRLFINGVREFLRHTETSTAEVKVSSEDVLVIPEIRASSFHRILPGVSKVILNQNPYFFFANEGLQKPELSICHPDIKAYITMSKLDYDMNCLAVSKNTWHVPYFINSKLYSYADEKKRQIAYMPRRLKGDSSAVINLLNLRGNLHGFTFVPIDNMSQGQVAHVMRESLIFLSFSNREGFGLPPAEAIACGCLVIGYSGNGGDEFFDEGLAFKILPGDLINYVKIVERTIAEYTAMPTELDKLRQRASQHILETYSKEKTRKQLSAVWNRILANLTD